MKRKCLYFRQRKVQGNAQIEGKWKSNRSQLSKVGFYSLTGADLKNFTLNFSSSSFISRAYLLHT